MADQRDPGSARSFFVGSECPAQQRCHAERLEEPGCHSRGADALRIASVRKVGGARGKGSELREALALLAPRSNVGVGRRNLSHTEPKAGIVRPNDGQLF